MIKMTLLYGMPEDTDAFETYYSETHMPIAAKIPGVDVQVIHVKYKEGNADSRVEILVIRSGPLVCWRRPPRGC